MGTQRITARAELSPSRTIALLSQPYVPDPAAVGQHVADVAIELAARGHRVIVFTARRGYEKASEQYSAREMRDGVEVRRLPFSSFGRRSNAVRFLVGLLFTLQATVRLLFLPGLETLVVSTTPPTAPLAAIVVGWVRRVRVVFWVMDLNPDQLIALGVAQPTSILVRAFDAMNRAILRVADAVVVLDRFMLDRVARKGDVADKLVLLPPWPPEDELMSVEAHDNPFRREHVADGQVVIMYSGNYSPTNPLTTIIDAARRLEHDPRFVFMFIGGGVGKREVTEANLRNVISLPYQPLDRLRFSLSAADIHVVTLGNAAVGVVHPCKVYGAMAVSRAILFVGPSPSHISDLIESGRVGWSVRHGDVDGVIRALEHVATDAEATRMAGARGYAIISERLSKRALCGAFCDVVEGRGAEYPPAAAERGH